MYFAAGRGRCASDAVWRQAVRSDAQCQAGEHAAAILWDISKFYERFDYILLSNQARELGLLMALLTLAVSVYRCARNLAQGGAVEAGLYVQKGVIAGCHIATSLVRVYTIRPFDAFTLQCPSSTLDVSVDDLTSSKTGTEQEVENDLARAATHLQHIVGAGSIHRYRKNGRQ